MPSEIRRPFFQDPGYLFFFLLLLSFLSRTVLFICLVIAISPSFGTVALLRNWELDSRCSFCFKSLRGRLSWVYDFWFQLFPGAVDQPGFPLDMISICILGLGHFPWTLHSAVGNSRYVSILLFYFLYFIVGGCLEFFYFWLCFGCHKGWISLFLLGCGRLITGISQ